MFLSKFSICNASNVNSRGLRASFCSLVDGISEELTSGASSPLPRVLCGALEVANFSLAFSLNFSAILTFLDFYLLAQQNHLGWVLHCFSLCIRCKAFGLVETCASILKHRSVCCSPKLQISICLRRNVESQVSWLKMSFLNSFYSSGCYKKYSVPSFSSLSDFCFPFFCCVCTPAFAFPHPRVSAAGYIHAHSWAHTPREHVSSAWCCRNSCLIGATLGYSKTAFVLLGDPLQSSSCERNEEHTWCKSQSQRMWLSDVLPIAIIES